jgi:4-amino-4-deoxy-L-arabinose transferase-like glycosyltransferase
MIILARDYRKVRPCCPVGERSRIDVLAEFRQLLNPSRQTMTRTENYLIRNCCDMRILWLFALGFSFVLSVFAAFRGGYIGPDYYTHFARLTEWRKIFDFSTTSPPTYYLLGHWLFLLIGSNNAFPIALSIAQSVLNMFAMLWFFGYTEQRFRSRLIHLAMVFFLAFLPVRVIHAATIGTDSMTVPLFVLVLFLLNRFLSEETPNVRSAVLLGLGIAVAVWTKYSFMAFIPAVFIILLTLWAEHRWRFLRFVAICALTLLLPSALALHSFWASSRVHGYNTEKHWLAKGEAPDMNYRDLLFVKHTDIQLFRAPEYFKREILESHRYSYLGLVHLGIFTDTMNLFQVLTVPQNFGSVLIPDQKTRQPWKTPVMRASMFLGVIWTVLVLVSVPWSLFHAFRNLIDRKLNREDVTAILGIAFFLIVFLLIPFVHGGALFGYWTPRLILPALLSFYLAAFLFTDRKIARGSTLIVGTVLVLVFVQCGLEAVMLT